MSLEQYAKKRDFRRTPEPKGTARRKGAKNSFVMQKHDATQLHYDLRLELDGALVSWAIPKGPSLDPRQKRLAVRVEDHPLEYRDFEGVIPKGQYGGGTVMIWDFGTWSPSEDDPAEALERGKLSFTLRGRKLRGEWTLARMKGRRDNDDDRDNWLLFKRDDDAASKRGQSILQLEPNSAQTGRSLKEIAREETKGSRDRGNKASTDRWKRQSDVATERRRWHSANGNRQSLPKLQSIGGAKSSPMPRATTPQLCTLADKAPAGHDWLHEIKFDGYRLLARRTKSGVRLLTRTGKDWTDRFSIIARAVAELPVENAVIDGEATILDKQGHTSFQQLQQAIKHRKFKNLVFFAFDLLYLNGVDLRDAALIDRKKLLHALIGETDRGLLRYTDHVRGSGPAVQQNACELALEGIISKRVDEPYTSGRSRTWLKVKCSRRQEFVVIGFSPPAGSRKHFGALLLGAYDSDNRLTYVGRVGTGFNTTTLKDVAARMKSLIRRTCPADVAPTSAESRGVTWVRPQLIAEVEFAQWTDDGRLRHPSFQGLREDKEPEAVMMEHAVSVENAARTAARAASGGDGKLKSRRNHKSATRDTGHMADSDSTVAGVKLSNADRVLYPEQGATKFDLARYYETVTEQLLPHIEDRPLSVVRCPRGRAHKCFFQKHLRDTLRDPVQAIPVKVKSEAAEYIGVDSVAGLVTLIQFGVLEIHPWGAKRDHLEKPDRLIFDLDPGEGAPFSHVREAAQLVRKELEALDLECYLKATGGKGLHVIAPLRPRADWDQTKAFAAAIAKDIAQREPGRYVATMSKQKRRGKIFIDYLRNSRGATSISPYSTRARLGAPVAMPLRWEEISTLKRADQFTIDNVPDRLLRQRREPWPNFFRKRQTLTASRLRSVGV